MTGYESLASKDSSSSSSDDDDDDQGGQDGPEDEFRDDEADPFEAAAAAVKEKEKEAAEKREADRRAKKKADKAKKKASEPPAASTPVPKKRRTLEGEAGTGDKSVMVEKVVKRKEKQKKKSSANSSSSEKSSANSSSSGRNSTEASTEAKEAGEDSGDSSDSSSSSDEDESRQEVQQQRKSVKKKKKKSHKRSDSDSDDTARKLIAGLARSLSKKKKKKNKKRSRSSSDSSSSDSDSAEESAVMTDKTWQLKDNGVDTLDMELRHLLRPPTTSPDVWWKAPFRSKVSRPVRGASLNMESVIGHARIHDSTIRRCHDRTALITTKMLLARNADISIKDTKLVKIGADKLSFDRKWAGPEAVSEIAEAVANFSAVIHYVRSYSYEGLAISRALHDAGWLLGVVSSEREQLELLEGTLDLLLSRNSQRARTNLPPLTHEQVRATIRTYLHRKGKSEAGLYGVDPYSGRKRLSERDQLKQDVEASIMSKMKGYNGGGSGPREGKKKDKKNDRKSGKMDGASKVARLCKDYNSQEGCQAQGDCPKGIHRCSRRKGDFVCQQDHPKPKCDHPKWKN